MAKGVANKFGTKKKGSKRGTASPFAILFQCFTTGKKQQIKNELTESEIVFYTFIFYLFTGNLFYLHLSSKSQLVDAQKGDEEGYTMTGRTLDVFYFQIVTMTTAGFGDLRPKPNAGVRTFSLFHAMLGVVLCFAGLAMLAEYIMDLHEGAKAKMTSAVLKAKAKENVPKSFSKHKLAGPDDDGEKADEDEDEDIESLAALQPNADDGTISKVLKRYPILGVVWTLGAFSVLWGGLYLQLEDGWTWIDGIYYTVITGTTIGFGDVTPATQGGRVLAIVFIPVAVVVVGNQLGAVGNLVMGNYEEDSLSKLQNLDLSLQALLDMDADGDGEVTEFEFIKFMLCKTGMCEESILDSLHERFKAMDTDGSGALDRDDLIEEPLGHEGVKVSKELAQIANSYGTSLFPKLGGDAAKKTKAHFEEIKTKEAFVVGAKRRFSTSAARRPSNAAATEQSKGAAPSSATVNLKGKVPKKAAEKENKRRSDPESSGVATEKKRLLGRAAAKKPVRNPVNEEEGSPNVTPNSASSRSRRAAPRPKSKQYEAPKEPVQVL